jgi:hypothetical protein
MDAQLDEAIKEIARIADRSYCQALDTLSSKPCLGAESKMLRGLFGTEEHEAHKKANRLMGKHFGMHEALKIIREAISKDTA